MSRTQLRALKSRPYFMDDAVQKAVVIITILLTEIQNICVNHVEINQRGKNRCTSQ